MFDFTFENVWGFLIAFIPAVINLALVFYIFVFLPKNRLVNIFAWLTFAMALWQVNDAIARISYTSAATDLWDCIFSPAWVVIGSLCLHFAMLYSGYFKPGGSRLKLLAVYLPALFFTSTYQAHVYPHVYFYSPVWGWVNYHDSNALDVIQIYWISVMVVIANVLLIRKTRQVRKDVL